MAEAASTVWRKALVVGEAASMAAVAAAVASMVAEVPSVAVAVAAAATLAAEEVVAEEAITRSDVPLRSESRRAIAGFLFYIRTAYRRRKMEAIASSETASALTSRPTPAFSIAA